MGGVEKEVLEAGLPPLLPQWIPKGYDLYILGVQECQCLKELRKMIHAYLGKSSETGKEKARNGTWMPIGNHTFYSCCRNMYRWARPVCHVWP